MRSSFDVIKEIQFFTINLMSHDSNDFFTCPVANCLGGVVLLQKQV
jgi:hypothetical protein